MSNLGSKVKRLQWEVEQLPQISSRLDSSCICYPQGKYPKVRFSILTEIAFMVKCPLHGDRFNLESSGDRVFRAEWLREKIEKLTYRPLSSDAWLKGSMAEQFLGNTVSPILLSFPRLMAGREREGDRSRRSCNLPTT